MFKKTICLLIIISFSFSNITFASIPSRNNLAVKAAKALFPEKKQDSTLKAWLKRTKELEAEGIFAMPAPGTNPDIAKQLRTTSLPTKTKVVVVETNKGDSTLYASSLISRLKRNNEVTVFSVSGDDTNLDDTNLDEISAKIKEIGPQILILPHPDDPTALAQEARWRALVASADTITAEIAYQTPEASQAATNASFFYGDDKDARKQAAIRTHPSQVGRLRFDLATQAANRASRLLSDPKDTTKKYSEDFLAMQIVNGELREVATSNRRLDLSENHSADRVDTVICLSPHPDDDVMSAGAYLADSADKGNDVYTLIMTTGHGADIPDDVFRKFCEDEGKDPSLIEKGSEEYLEIVKKLRESEAVRASSIIGIPKDNVISLRMGFYDYRRYDGARIITIADQKKIKKAIDRIYEAHKKKGGDAKFEVILPHISDVHPDHQATRIAMVYLSELSAREKITIDLNCYTSPWAGNYNLYCYMNTNELREKGQLAKDFGIDEHRRQAAAESSYANGHIGTELVVKAGFGAAVPAPEELGSAGLAERFLLRTYPSPQDEEELVSRVKVAKSEKEMGEEAARAILEDIKEAIRTKGKAVMLFASAPSQHATWDALIKLAKADMKTGQLDTSKIVAFHMDEYLGLPEGAEQLFGKVLRERLFDVLKIPKKQIYYFKDRTAFETAKELREELAKEQPDQQKVAELTTALEESAAAEAERITNAFIAEGGKFDITVGGQGVHPHVAFNDAPDASFTNEPVVKVVRLSETSREQQVKDGEFATIADVPTHALTFTLPPIFASGKIHIIVPREFKAPGVAETLDGEITEAIPASGLRMPHILSRVTFYLDPYSASESRIARAAAPEIFPSALLNRLPEFTLVENKPVLAIGNEIDTHFLQAYNTAEAEHEIDPKTVYSLRLVNNQLEMTARPDLAGYESVDDFEPNDIAGFDSFKTADYGNARAINFASILVNGQRNPFPNGEIRSDREFIGSAYDKIFCALALYPPFIEEVKAHPRQWKSFLTQQSLTMTGIARELGESLVVPPLSPIDAKAVLANIQASPDITVDPSLTTLQFLLEQRRGEEFIQMAQWAEAAGAGALHIDIFDHNFVDPAHPDGNMHIFTPALIARLRNAVSIPIVVHLMVRSSTPKTMDYASMEDYVGQFMDNGAKFVELHWSAFRDKVELRKCAELIKAKGGNFGLTFNPNEGTELDTAIEDGFLELSDYCLVMTVIPGKGGKGLDERAVKLLDRLEEVGEPVIVAVDGAMKPETVGLAVGRGAKLVCAGSAVFGKEGAMADEAGIKANIAALTESAGQERANRLAAQKIVRDIIQKRLRFREELTLGLGSSPNIISHLIPELAKLDGEIRDKIKIIPATPEIEALVRDAGFTIISAETITEKNQLIDLAVIEIAAEDLSSPENSIVNLAEGLVITTEAANETIIADIIVESFPESPPTVILTKRDGSITQVTPLSREGAWLPYSKRELQHLEVLTMMNRRDMIQAIRNAGSGHPGGSLSFSNIVTTAYSAVDSGGNRLMRIDPENPGWYARDMFIASKGHAAPALYIAQARAGFYPAEDVIAHLRDGVDSPYQGHPDERKNAAVDLSTGALGQGLATAVGMAIGARLSGQDSHLWVGLGGGECQEGLVKESASFVPALRNQGIDPTNLTAIIDHNESQIMGEESLVRVTDLAAEWTAWGWNVLIVDGHNQAELAEAMHIAKTRGQDPRIKRPTCIIARTSKGKGVSTFEASPSDYHGAFPKSDEEQEAVIAELQAAVDEKLAEFGISDEGEVLEYFASRPITPEEVTDINAANPEKPDFDFEAGELPKLEAVATRAVKKDLFPRLSIVGVDPDLGASTNIHTAPICISTGISEGLASFIMLGLAKKGILSAVASFDIFTSTYMMPALEKAVQMGSPGIFIGTHMGSQVGPDAESHQSKHSLATIYGLCGEKGDGLNIRVAADARENRIILTHLAEKFENGELTPEYLMEMRQKTPLLPTEDIEDFERKVVEDGCYVLHDPGNGDNDLIIAATGATVHHALATAERLKNELGLNVKVINVISPNMIKQEGNPFITEYLEDNTPIITVVDNDAQGLSSPVTDAINVARREYGKNPGAVYAGGITKLGSDDDKALFALNGIDADGIFALAEEIWSRHMIQQDIAWRDELFEEIITSDELSRRLTTEERERARRRLGYLSREACEEVRANVTAPDAKQPKTAFIGLRCVDTIVPVDGSQNLMEGMEAGTLAIDDGGEATDEWKKSLPPKSRTAIRQSEKQILLSGGPASSAARVAAQLGGLNVSLVTSMGNDRVNEFDWDDDDLGINTDHSVLSDKPTPTTIYAAEWEEDGAEERSFLHAMGASTDLTIDNIPEDIFLDLDVAAIGAAELTGLMPDIVRILEMANEAGCVTVMDTVADPNHTWFALSEKYGAGYLHNVLSRVDVFTPSIKEAQQIMGDYAEKYLDKRFGGSKELSYAGIAGKDEKDLTDKDFETIIEFFISHSAKAVFLKAGKRGVYVKTTAVSVFGEDDVDETEFTNIPILKGFRAESATGTGDAFTGALVHMVANGELNARKVAMFANVVGGMCAQYQGGTIEDEFLLDAMYNMERLQAQMLAEALIDPETRDKALELIAYLEKDRFTRVIDQVEREVFNVLNISAHPEMPALAPETDIERADFGLKPFDRIGLLLEVITILNKGKGKGHTGKVLINAPYQTLIEHLHKTVVILPKETNPNDIPAGYTEIKKVLGTKAAASFNGIPEYKPDGTENGLRYKYGDYLIYLADSAESNPETDFAGAGIEPVEIMQGKAETFFVTKGEGILLVDKDAVELRYHPEGEVAAYDEDKIPEDLKEKLAELRKEQGDAITTTGVLRMVPGTIVRLKKNTKHAFLAGKDGAVYMEVSGPSNDKADDFSHGEMVRIPKAVYLQDGKLDADLPLDAIVSLWASGVTPPVTPGPLAEPYTPSALKALHTRLPIHPNIGKIAASILDPVTRESAYDLLEKLKDHQAKNADIEEKVYNFACALLIQRGIRHLPALPAKMIEHQHYGITANVFTNTRSFKYSSFKFVIDDYLAGEDSGIKGSIFGQFPNQYVPFTRQTADVTFVPVTGEALVLVDRDKYRIIRQPNAFDPEDVPEELKTEYRAKMKELGRNPSTRQMIRLIPGVELQIEQGANMAILAGDTGFAAYQFTNPEGTPEKPAEPAEIPLVAKVDPDSLPPDAQKALRERGTPLGGGTRSPVLSAEARAGVADGPRSPQAKLAEAQMWAIDQLPTDREPSVAEISEIVRQTVSRYAEPDVDLDPAALRSALLKAAGMTPKPVRVEPDPVDDVGDGA